MCQNNKNWKFYLGIALLFFTCIADIVFFFVPFMGFSKTQVVTYMVLLTVASESISLIAILLLGKTIVNKLKEKFAIWFKRPEPVAPVFISRKRHATGVWLFFISLLTYPLIEISLLFGYPATGEHIVYFFVLIFGDILFVISLFVLGETFWDKLKNLFKYTDNGHKPVHSAQEPVIRE